MADGAHVAFSARRKDKLDEAIAEAGGGHPVVADISTADDCARLGSEAAAAVGGPIDVVFISAGSAPMRMFKDTSPEDWKHVLDLNVVGIHQVIRSVLPHLSPGSDRRRGVERGRQPTSHRTRCLRREQGGARTVAHRVAHRAPRGSLLDRGGRRDRADRVRQHVRHAAADDRARRLGQAGAGQADFMDSTELGVYLAAVFALGLRFPGINVDHIVLRSPSAVTDEHQGHRAHVQTRMKTDVYWDPFDVEIDTDPYPVWRRLRDERPLYRNERYDFWALSRYEDVEAAHRDPRRFSSAHGTVLEIMGPEPIPHRADDLHGPARRTPAADAGVAGVHPAPRGRARGAHPRALRASCSTRVRGGERLRLRAGLRRAGCRRW